MGTSLIGALAGEWPSWLRTTADEAWRLIDQALEQEPTLLWSGFGLQAPDRKRVYALPCGLVREAERKRIWEEEVAAWRTRGHLVGVAASADWLDQVARIKTVNRSAEIYSLKHRVERWCGNKGISHPYIGQGTTAAAAIARGFAYKVSDRGAMYVGISKRSLPSPY